MSPSFTLLSRQQCRWAAAATMSAAVASSPFIVPAQAQAVGTANVSIYVYKAATGDSLAGQNVLLYSTTTGAPVGPAKITDAGGSVSFPGLDLGGYIAKVAGSATYREEYSRAVIIEDAGEFDGTSVSLDNTGPTNGRLSGAVSKGNTTQLDAEIQIFPASATAATIASGAVSPVYESSAYDYNYGTGTVSDDWEANVAPGSYKVLVGDDRTADTIHHDAGTPGYSYDDWDEHASQVWVGAPAATNDADHATSLVVAAGAVRSAGTTTLAPGVTTPVTPAQVSGTVTGVAGAKLDEVHVRLFRQETYAGTPYWNQVDSDTTYDNGAFGFNGDYQYDYDTGDVTYLPLPAGVYTVTFDDQRDEYGAEALGDVATDEGYNVPAGAQTFTVTGSETHVANGALGLTAIDKSSGINGKVTNDLGQAREGYISLYNTWGDQVYGEQTRRDGTWSIPTTAMPPGTYKVYASDDEQDISSWYGGATFKTGATYVVGVKGAKAAGNSNLKRYTSIAGTIGLAAAPGDASYRWVNLYDADGDRLETTETDSAGHYKFAEQRPGTYYVSADAERWSSFDNSDLRVSSLEYIKQWFAGKFTAAGATPITVGSGANRTGVNITLGRTLAATTAPRITGTPRAGYVLRASNGVWNVRSNVSFSYVWKRGTRVLSRSSSYRVKRTDRGKTITLTVTAVDTTREYATGSRTTAGMRIRLR